MNKKLIALTIGALVAVAALAQTTDADPAVQQAKEETAVVYDLGRFFGYVHTMVTEDSTKTLDSDQIGIFEEMMGEIVDTARLEADRAAEMLGFLELDVLTPGQLMAVDMLAIAREESRESTAGTGTGGGTGQGPIQSYIAGGPFNPLLDYSKSLGQGFKDLLDWLEANN